jgi:hypothetical protein
VRKFIIIFFILFIIFNCSNYYQECDYNIKKGYQYISDIKVYSNPSLFIVTKGEREKIEKEFEGYDLVLKIVGVYILIKFAKGTV